MYAAASDVQVGAYPDLRQKGRYRVELRAKSVLDPGYIDAALQQMGYAIIDADQWGCSYRHRRDYAKTAELDELEDEAVSAKLVLRSGELDEADTGDAEEQLRSLHDRIQRLCRGDYSQYCYGSPDGLSQLPGDVTVKRDLTYSMS
jgi:hypothetical protein